MKTFKRTLSLVLTLCIVASIAVIATVSVSANAGDPIRRPVISSVVNQSGNPVSVKRYYFYMPSEWKNEYNDFYNLNGNGLEDCRAGVYWSNGSFKPADKVSGNEWPGYAIADRDETDSNIYYADIPADVSSVNFNNLVDGGMDPAAPEYDKAYQTFNVKCDYYDEEDDGYRFYTEGIESFENMIFVTDPTQITENTLSHKLQYGGNWFYYYGEGKYGIYPTIEEAEAQGAVLSKGDFPSTLQLDPQDTTLYVNNSKFSSVKITPSDITAVAEALDPSIVSVTQDKTTGVATVKAKKAGETKVVFTTYQENGEVDSIRKATVVVAYWRPQINDAAASVELGKTINLASRVTYGGTTTYSTSKASVAAVSAKGVVTGKAVGTANITVKTVAGSYKVTKTIKVTVKKAANNFTATGKTITASAKKKTTFAASKIATIKNKKGTVTYQKASGDKKVTITKAGKLTVNKGLKKGKTITVKIKVTDAGTSKYASAVKTISVKIKVK